jgi:hypothetical protein
MSKTPKRSIAKPARQGKQLPKDIAILHGPTEDGEGARMLRFKEGAVYAGEVRPVREGQSVQHQELVRLRPLDPDLPVCEVEVLHAPAEPAAQKRQSSGPARFTTDGYRRNWGAVFGRDRDESWSLN